MSADPPQEQGGLVDSRTWLRALTPRLRADEDLANMYLTDKLKGVPRSIDDHQQAELLLEYCCVAPPSLPLVHPLSRGPRHSPLTRSLIPSLRTRRRAPPRRDVRVVRALSTLLAEVDSNISLVLASTRVRLQVLELQVSDLNAPASFPCSSASLSSRLSSSSFISAPASSLHLRNYSEGRVRARSDGFDVQTAIGTLALGAGATAAGFFGASLLHQCS